MTLLPADHDQRRVLNDEVHARPPDALTAPLRIAFLALFSEGLTREAVGRPIQDLARRFGLPPPPLEANHFSADLGPLRVTWERHTEFARYSFIETVPSDAVLFSETPLRLVPRDWLQALPGRTFVAAQVAYAAAPKPLPQVDTLSERYFSGNLLVGAEVADGDATAFTDFRIHSDGFSRMLLFDHGLSPRQAGRTVQRLLEIDAYRLLATMALPVARDLTPFLARAEADLAAITSAMTKAAPMEEPGMLNKLIDLEAEIESRRSKTVSRFDAAGAYYDLVQRRIDELRERRLVGLQTFKELTERRLVPAIKTCGAVAARQEALSRRVTRATQLLSTRVDITRETQNQALLESMNRRAQMQLHLQQTVEGLSVAAVTYYVVGLVGYVAKGLQAAGFSLKPDFITAASIPIVALAVASGLRRVRRAWGSGGSSPKDARKDSAPH